MLLSYALENLSTIKDLQKRTRLVDWANARTDLDAQDKLDLINVIDEAYKVNHEDINYDEVISLLPAVSDLLGIDQSQKGYWKHCILRGIALNPTREKIEQLVRDMKEFFGHYQKNNDSTELVACGLDDYSVEEKGDAFDVMAHISEHLRGEFLRVARDVCPIYATSASKYEFWIHLSILRSFLVYKSVEEVQSFLEQINSILPKEKYAKINAIGSFHRMLNAENRSDLLAHAVRLTTDPTTNELTTDEQIRQDVLERLSFLDPKSRRELITDVEATASAEVLDWKQRNLLLTIVARNNNHKEDLQTIKGLSWRGKDTPSFKEQLDFVNSFHNSCILSFGYNEGERFSVALNCAGQYLTPELVEKNKSFFCRPWAFSNDDFGYEPFVMSTEEHEQLLSSLFKSSTYDNLSGAVDTVGRLLKKIIKDLGIELTAADKSDMLLAVAKIEPSLRTSKIETAEAAVNAANKDYFANFMQYLQSA